jgi:hypothetical protein
MAWTSGSSNRKARLEWLDGWVLTIVLTILIASAVFIAALYAFDDAKANLGSALVQGAIEILFVGLIGGLLTGAVKAQLARQEEERKRLAAQQEEQRRLDDYRVRQLLDIVGAYNEAKAVRRALRACGFGQPGPRTFASWQVEEFRRQMLLLSNAELSMEKSKRALRFNLGLLLRREGLENALRGVEEYLQTVTDEWEAKTLELAADDVDIQTDFKALFGFLAGDEEDEDGTFKREVSSRMRYIQDCIRIDIAKQAKAEREELPEPERPEPVRRRSEASA